MTERIEVVVIVDVKEDHNLSCGWRGRCGGGERVKVGSFKPKDLTHSLHHLLLFLAYNYLLMQSYEKVHLQLDHHGTSR